MGSQIRQSTRHEKNRSHSKDLPIIRSAPSTQRFQLAGYLIVLLTQVHQGALQPPTPIPRPRPEIASAEMVVATRISCVEPARPQQRHSRPSRVGQCFCLPVNARRAVAAMMASTDHPALIPVRPLSRVGATRPCPPNRAIHGRPHVLWHGTGYSAPIGGAFDSCMRWGESFAHHCTFQGWRSCVPIFGVASFENGGLLFPMHFVEVGNDLQGSSPTATLTWCGVQAQPMAWHDRSRIGLVDRYRLSGYGEFDR
jgi:hypothetical protein